MDEIKILHKSTFLGKEIDVWGTFENPLFRASDVANWLHNTNVSNMVKKVDEDEVTKFNLGSRQGETLFLTENGLYEILMLSRKKDAKQFKKGVKKILHEIRTKGGYLATTQNDTPATILARAMKVADEVIAEHEQRIKELEEQGRRQEIVIEQKDAQIDAQDKQIKIAAPKADYYDKTLASTSCMTTTQVADDLHITANALNRKLQEIGIIYSQSGQWHLKMPYKKWNLAGTRTYNYQSSNGDILTKVTLVWNQRGKRFILALYNNNFDVKRAIAEIKGDISNK
ncbi:phage antirepressor KilAC domain-containing protein [Leyella stercorea]|uniref:phage antirepressor KilAC domain-containing protein n=1 Tax=Leyella stercorea TaxID=363265 RepID=UPI00266C49E5|nr:phage antirepressor KilAC domain-containing protein [Leyella stercorea]